MAPDVLQDFYGGGPLDIAFSGFNDGYIVIEPLDSAGDWGLPKIYQSSARFAIPTSMVAADFNGDGKDSIAFLEQGTTGEPDQLYLLLSDPDTNQMEPFLQQVPVSGANLALVAGAFSGTTAPTGFMAPMGEPSTLVHNESGTWTQSLPDGTVIQFDASGQETSQTDRNGNTTSYTYVTSGAAAGALATMTDPVGLVTTLGYDTSGRLSTVTDPAGRITYFSLNGYDNLTTIADPSGSITQYGYSTPGNHEITSETNPNSQTAVPRFRTWWK